jgi:hypothetical protein
MVITIIIITTTNTSHTVTALIDRGHCDRASELPADGTLLMLQWSAVAFCSINIFKSEV